MSGGAGAPGVRFSAVAFTSACLVLAGCIQGEAGGPAGPKGVAEEKRGEGPSLVGIVTDDELRPIAGAKALLRPGEFTAASDESGLFVIGPLDPGPYTLLIEAEGFEAKELAVTIVDGAENRVWVTLPIQLAGTPYHETQIYTTYTFCALPSAPCAPVNTVTSENLTPDRPDLKWSIPGPGLANMRYEVTWPQQLTSGDKSFTTRNPEGLFLNCGSTAGQYPTLVYFSEQGPSGFGMWVWPGITNEGGCAEFDGTAGKVYYTVNRPRSTNATIPIGLSLDQRITNYLTFFFYLEGPPGFTAIPDQ